MRQSLVLVAVVGGLAALAFTRPPENETPDRFLDVLSSGDHVTIERVDTATGEIDLQLRSEKEVEALTPTPEERKEWEEFIEKKRAAGPGGIVEFEDRARYQELHKKMNTVLYEVMEVGDDYIALRSSKGVVQYFPERKIKAIRQYPTPEARDATRSEER